MPSSKKKYYVTTLKPNLTQIYYNKLFVNAAVYTYSLILLNVHID